MASRGDFQLVDAEFVSGCFTVSGHDGECQLLEAHFTSSDHPSRSDRQDAVHIPGAIQVHPSYLESGTDRSRYYPCYEHPSDGNLLPDRDLVLALQGLGITPKTLVVIYGREPDGTMAAARLVWALLYAGVRRVRLLDGGLDAWLDHGGATCSQVEAVPDIGGNDQQLHEPHSQWTIRPELLATTAEVRDLSQGRGSPFNKLVDVRGAGEWDGTLTGHYPFFSKAGHIPGALFQGDWDNLLDPSTQMLGPTLNAIAQRWREQGILDACVEARRTTLVFYCGTGWRSSVALLVALLLGLRAKNYDSGFYGWSWGSENEIAVAKWHG